MPARLRNLSLPRQAGRAVFVCLALSLAGPAQARRAVNSCTDPTTFNNASMAVSMPVLEYTVTTFDPNWFDTDLSANAPTLFTLLIPSSLDTLIGRLRLRVRIEVDTSLGRNPGTAMVAMDQISNLLTPAQVGFPLTSNQVFSLTYQTGISFKQSPFYALVEQNHQVPEMNLRFIFELACEDGGVAAWTSGTIKLTTLGLNGKDTKLRYVHTVQALSPGTDLANPRPVSIYTLTPVFQIASELYNNQEFIYAPGEDKMQIFLYQLDAGQSPTDAMQGMEFAKFPVPNQYPVAYPAGLPRLTPGKTYVWRARALLRGPDAEYRYSNALYFTVDPLLDGGGSPQPPSILTDLKAFEQQVKYGDDYVKRVMAALKIILGENYEVFDLSRANKIPAKGQIRLNGRPYSLEELERLAREFHQSHHSVTRLRFQ